MKSAAILTGTFFFLTVFNFAQDQKETEQFNAVVNDNMASLSWVMKKELKDCNYSVERSGDGESFYSIHILGGTPSPYDRHYVWIDRQPLQGESWYRIKKTAADGIIYSSAIKVKVKGAVEFSQR